MHKSQRTHASTAPAVVPAMSECSGFSFFDIVVCPDVEDEMVVDEGKTRRRAENATLTRPQGRATVISFPISRAFCSRLRVSVSRAHDDMLNA